LEDLARPLVDDLSRLWPTLAHPRLERPPAILGVIFVRRLVVFAADDQGVVRSLSGQCTRRRFVEPLQTDEVIWVGRIPVESRRYRAARHDGGDHERP